MIKSRHFTEEEFNKCNPTCSMQEMKQSTIDKADLVRDLIGQPLFINCAYRSSEHDKRKGRSGTGAHTTGNAIDFRCSNSRDRFKIVQACIDAGFSRIGVAENFIHVDDSFNHDQYVLWTY